MRDPADPGICAGPRGGHGTCQSLGSPVAEWANSAFTMKTFGEQGRFTKMTYIEVPGLKQALGKW